jgi:hypothetical protein
MIEHREPELKTRFAFHSSASFRDCVSLSGMEIAERYVRLAHGINAHHDGFVDSYVGPPVWTEVNRPNLDSLERDCSDLESAVAALTEVSRRDFLTVQVRAMRTMLRLLAGESISYTQEVEGLHDILPEVVPESDFETALQNLEAVLPGPGSLSNRWEALRARFRVDPDRMKPVLAAINARLRQRTKALFELPDFESVQIELVRDKPWGGYNWYLGNAVSRVDINTDLPSYLHALPDLMAHEGYPGHHTERIFKDALYRTMGWAEYSVQLLNSPESVLAEGIATNALELITSPDELPAWVAELAPLAGLSLCLEECETIFVALQAMGALAGARGNVALMLHRDGASDADAVEYLSRYALMNRDRALKSLEFIKHPNSRAYVYTYTVGYRLVRDALQSGDRLAMYRRLLTEPMTPSQLRGFAV